MRRVIGVGETILDILFKGSQPQKAVPGGSSFNGIVSLGRMGIPVFFFSEIGNDKIGDIIIDFMKENNISTEYVTRNTDIQTAVSFAFLNDNNDAEYEFFKDYKNLKLGENIPDVTNEDILLFGSFYALNPVLRPIVYEIVQKASGKDAIVYYDVNFRKTHADDIVRLNSTVIENIEFSDIVRGSREDFLYLYKSENVDYIYSNHISYDCPYFIYTAAERGIDLRTPVLSKHYDVEKIEPLSTIGAGDSFNAGILYSLYSKRIRKADLPTLSEKEWDEIIGTAMKFSSFVCRSFDNYVSKDFAAGF